MSRDYQLPILLYDSECSLCTRFMHSLDRVDSEKQINKISIHNEDIYKVYDFLEREECAEDVHYIDSNGKVYVGAEAVAELIKIYPAVKSFAWLLDSEMGKRSIDLFYSAASSIRKHKKCPDCGKKKRSAQHSSKCKKKILGLFSRA